MRHLQPGAHRRLRRDLVDPEDVHPGAGGVRRRAGGEADVLADVRNMLADVRIFLSEMLCPTSHVEIGGETVSPPYGIPE